MSPQQSHRMDGGEARRWSRQQGGQTVRPARNGTVDLADGRQLSYADWGEPDAPPVVYCHGFPGSRREIDLMTAVLDRRDVSARILALDRPGFGASTFQPNRRFASWPSDVAEAADTLGLRRFAMLGVSGGAPYALVCGRDLADRVTRVGVVVGVGPLEATGMDRATAVAGPSSVGAVRRFQFGMAAYAFRKGHASQFIDQAVASMGSVDRDAMARPEVCSWFTDVMGDAFSQGAQGVALEAGLYRRSWGFDPSEVEAHTHLWYSGADRTVPASVGVWLHDRLPNATTVVWPNHGHFTWMMSDHAADVVASITEHGRS